MKSKLLFTIVTVFVLLLGACTTETVTESTTLYKYVMTYDEYMNTVTYITVFHDENEDLETLSEGIEEILLKQHNIFNAKSDTSELGLVNSNAFDNEVTVSDELFKVLETTMEIAEISNGKYDPTIGPLAELWNITGESWYLGGVIPSDEEIQDRLSYVDYNNVVLNDGKVTFLKEGISLDLGGVAKGYISMLLRDYLLEVGIEHAIINVGSSSQLTIGTRCVEDEVTDETTYYKITEDPWRIGTINPYDLLGFQGPVGIFTLQDKALSSSGSAQQFFEVDGVRYHHIFDTSTGYPTDNELIVVQIITNDLVGIDALSTMIYAMGLEEGMAFVEKTDGLEAIFITYDKEIYLSSSFGEYELTNNEYKIA